jgi:hypothetical protein
MIAEEIVDIEIEPTEMLLKNMAKFPDVAQYVKDNNGNVPAFFFEEELISHEEFGEYLKKSAYERFGITLDLSPSNLATFE